MRTEGKSELKGAFKAIIAIVLVMGVIGLVAAAYVSNPTISDTLGFQWGNVSIGDESITINSTEITGDAFGDVTFFSYSFMDEKTYAVPAIANTDYYILEVFKEIEITPEGTKLLATSYFCQGSVKNDEDSGNIFIGTFIGFSDAAPSVGGSPFTGLIGSAYTDIGSYSNTTYVASSSATMGGGWEETVTTGDVCYGYIVIYAYSNEADGSEPCTAYIKNFSAGTIVF